MATECAYHAEAKTLTVTLPKAHALRVGERVRLVSESDETKEFTVVEVPANNRFVVGEVSRDPKQVFVYGREVPDFLSVNYDRIFSTGIGAIQELARQVNALQSRQAQMTGLEQKAARVDALEEELAALKKVLARQQEANARWEARFSALEKDLAAHKTPSLRDSTPTGAAVQ
jgi:hypothetical protein